MEKIHKKIEIYKSKRDSFFESKVPTLRQIKL